MSRKKTAQPTAPKPAFLIFTVLCTGAGILMLEVLGARIAGPFFGVSLYIWTALISVTLAALTLGYWLGGILCDRRPDPDLLYGLILAAGLMIALIAGVDEAVLGFSYKAFSGVWRLRLGVLLGSLILFAPPLTLLGMVSPFVLKLALADLRQAGRTAGRLYAVSTVGSVAGSIATGYFLIPALGIAKTLFVITALILLPAVIWFAGARRFGRLAAAALLLIAAFFLPAARLGAQDNPNFKLVHLRDGLYGQIKVMDYRREKETERYLFLEGTYQSSTILGSGGTSSKYISVMDYFLHFYAPEGKKLLLVGLGGGSFVKPLLAAGYEVDVVEIDPAIIETAVDYFGLDTQSCRIITEDGRAYLRTTNERYDVILFDVAGGGSQPAHLVTREAFAETRAVLKSGGLVGLNLIGYPRGDKAVLTRSLFRTARSVFDEGRAYWVDAHDTAEEINNLVMFFTDTAFTEPDSAAFNKEEQVFWERLSPRRWPLDPGQGTIITDNHNPIDRWSVTVNEDWRLKLYDSRESTLFTY